MTVKILGNFLQQFPPEHDSLELTFTPTSRPIKQRWRNNRLSAHFVAEYLSTFLPVDEEDTNPHKRIQQSKGAVSYIANELLENAMKFNDDNTNLKIRFGIHFVEKEDLTAIIFVTNSIRPKEAENFQNFIDELLTEDTSELYIRRVEKSVEEENSDVSGLGLLTMINDYQALLGWKFDIVQLDPKIIRVTTMAQVIV